ncbi:MAG TPA: sugar ABC transporter ATP-binding protein [Anaeromyxobacter sp.]|nr:sugar ABC transporter ATP-binding protein [Anaeromyxobacter sp.]
MAEKAPLLELRNVCKAFSGVEVLHDVSFDLHAGEVHCVVGENGAGKSTLIKIISGAYSADSGRTLYFGEEAHHADPRWVLSRGISTIYQEIDLVPALSVAENICLGKEPRTRSGNVDRPAMKRLASRVLDEIGVSLDLAAPAGTLTVAHQQMVAIARALSVNSRVLLLDEPTAVFTATEVEVLFRIVRRLKGQGLGIIYISHHLEEIFQIGDRITVMRDGRVTRTGAAEDFDRTSLVRAMVGRDIDFSRKAEGGTAGEEMLRVEKLTRRRVFEDVSFSLRRGEVLGVAGLVGSGRTELARAIFGVDRFDEGALYVRGIERRFRSPRHALREGLGMLPENRKEEGLVQSRPVLENAAYSSVQLEARFGFVPWGRIRRAVRGVIGHVGVRCASTNMNVRALSGGNQQKVVIAKWLAARSDILILDEPTRGVDVGAREEIYALMRAFKADGKAILMISSDLPELLTQADRILVMAKGHIVGEMPREQASEEAVLGLALEAGRGDRRAQ